QTRVQDRALFYWLIGPVWRHRPTACCYKGYLGEDMPTSFDPSVLAYRVWRNDVKRSTGDAVLSTARRAGCLFHANNSGGHRQFTWLWWTALVSISAEERPGELVRQS